MWSCNCSARPNRRRLASKRALAPKMPVMINATRPPRSIHVIAGISDFDGGPAYSVPALVKALSEQTSGASLWTVARPRETMGPPSSAVRYPQSRGLVGARLRASRRLRRALSSLDAANCILHAHGVWLLPNLYPAWARNGRTGSLRLVHSPRGMLAPEAFRISAWKKRLMWPLGQRGALASADCLHATSLSEYEEIRALGLGNPVAVIPNGVDLPDLAKAPNEPRAGRVVLYLGRIHPKKGLEQLVRAWAAVEGGFPDASLRIVGPAEVGHDTELRRLAGAVAASRITVEPPIFSTDEKLLAYRAADLFVLPTRNENFGMTVAEALAAETPVISTKGAPWSGLESRRCGWWIDFGVEPLVAALREALAMPRPELRVMGERGRQWMASDFGWAPVASDMADVYTWLMAGGDVPQTVRLR